MNATCFPKMLKITVSLYSICYQVGSYNRVKSYLFTIACHADRSTSLLFTRDIIKPNGRMSHVAVALGDVCRIIPL